VDEPLAVGLVVGDTVADGLAEALALLSVGVGVDGQRMQAALATTGATVS
jgi:hypothetical protein